MKIKKLLYFLIFPILIFSLFEQITAQKRKAVPKKTIVTARKPLVVSTVAQKMSPETQRRLDAFKFAWETIKNNYFDQTFSGLNWENIRLEYTPRVLNSVSDKQFHQILQEMIGRLHRSHFAVIPPEVFEEINKAKVAAKEKEKKLESEKKGNEESTAEIDDESEDEIDDFDEPLAKYGLGIDVRLINNQFIVTRIEKDSAAAKADFKTGYIIEKINGVSLGEMLKRVEAVYSVNKNVKKHLPAQIVSYFLNGNDDTEVLLNYLDENDSPKETKIKRKRLKGDIISIGENYPEQFLRFEVDSINNDVGYIKFNIFAIPIIGKFCDALTELKDKKAIIVDLRGNVGGILGTMVALGGMLTDREIDLGTSVYKVGSENLKASSKAKNFKGKLVFLVDNQTVSSAEVFTAAVQENNRALVVGERTAGEALPAFSVKLQTGATLFYPIANFKTFKGNFLEGKGVEPNYVVALERNSLLAGKDNQLETALQIINENKDFPTALPIAPPIVVASADEPAPAVVAPKPKGKVIAQVTVTAPPPIEVKEAPPVKEEKAVQIIDEFIKTIGGEKVFDSVNSYALRGTADISLHGSKSGLTFAGYRQMPDKYAEILSSPVIGDVREIYSGKKFYLQSDFGMSQEFELPIETEKVEIFSPLKFLLRKKLMKSLTYRGVFERRGRQTHLIEGETADNASLAFAFDVENKTLVSYNGAAYEIVFDDYRPVGNLKLPFKIERSGIVTIALDEIKLNATIEDYNFTKKISCFDKVD